MSEQLIYDHVIETFISNLDNSTPIYTLTPEHARKTLQNIQNVKVNVYPVDIKEYVLPVMDNITIKIVRPANTLVDGDLPLLPIIVYFHGGGWILGDFQVFYRLVSEIAYYTGCAVIFVEYTPSPEAKYPIPVEQAYSVTKYISDNALSYRLDGNKLGIVGDSVGGNMAIAVSLMAKELNTPRIDFQVLFYPVTDANFDTESYKKYKDGPWLTKNSMTWFWDSYSQNRDYITVVPLRADINQLRGLPPALIITAEHDVLRDEGEAYARKLLQADVSVLSMRYLGAIHDFLMLNNIANSKVTRSALFTATQFITQHFNE